MAMFFCLRDSNPVCLTYLPITGGRKDGFILRLLIPVPMMMTIMLSILSHGNLYHPSTLRKRRSGLGLKGIVNITLEREISF